MKDRLHSKCPNGQQIDFSENGLKGGDSAGPEPETTARKKNRNPLRCCSSSIDLSFRGRAVVAVCRTRERSRMENEIRHLRS